MPIVQEIKGIPGSVRGFATRKAGPLPVWGWALVAGGGVAAYLWWKGHSGEGEAPGTSSDVGAGGGGGGGGPFAPDTPTIEAPASDVQIPETGGPKPPKGKPDNPKEKITPVLSRQRDTDGGGGNGKGRDSGRGADPPPPVDHSRPPGRNPGTSDEDAPQSRKPAPPRGDKPTKIPTPRPGQPAYY